jgi:hypothetical protein
MMTDWYEKSMRALQLAGKGERTQQAYTRSVRKLVEFFDKSPELISETELQDYFLHRRIVDEWSPNTMRICHAGIRFFFAHVLERDWRTFDYLGAQKEFRLPTVLSREEVRAFLRSHQRIGYAALFAASSEAIKALCTDPRFTGGDTPGFFGVLHTWGRQLQYHPHIHYVVPGGMLASQNGQWHPSAVNFYLPV